MTVAQTRYRRLRLGDDSGSMPLAMLLTIVGVGLSLLLATTVIAQQKTTRFDLRRAHALNAAETGIAAAVSNIKATIKSDGSGDLSLLPPCGTITGTVSQGATASYSVAIYYVSSEPPSGDVAWAKAHAMCANGAKPTTVPRYALLESTGYELPATPGRKLVATYTFSTNTSNPNITGGLIHIFRPGAGLDLCLSADRDQPGGGEPLIVAICDATSDRQQFAYEANLNLVLVASRTQARPAGMCVDAGTTLVQNAAVTFRPCAATTTPRQQWGQNDYSAFQGTTDGVNLNNFCLNVQNPGNISPVILGDANQNQGACYAGWTDNKTVFPDASVGTGKAGPSTKQLVNYDQFGRCIDVTGNDPGAQHLVVFPCKQQPSGSVGWNQTWNMPAVPANASSASGPIHTTVNGQTYCLLSPGSTAANTYLKLAVCNPASVTAGSNLWWTYRTDTGVYSTSYRIESTYGAAAGSQYCVSPTDPKASPPDLWHIWGESITFSKVVLATCSSSALQKWNASPTIIRSALKDVVEQ